MREGRRHNTTLRPQYWENSEGEPQVQTDGPRSLKDARDCPCGASPDKTIGVIVSWGIGEIVEQYPQLQHLLLMNCEVLEETLVPAEQLGPAQDIDSAIPEGVIGRSYKRVRVKPASYGPLVGR